MPASSVPASVLLSVLACRLRVVGAVSLPSFQVDSPEAAARYSFLERGKAWSFQVGDHVYHAPDESLDLSKDLNDYYYAIGSHTALTDEMRAHRVGGEGRWHIFHLPEGPSMLQTLASVSSSGDRRSGISSLTQLQSNQILPKEFPEYKVSSSYENPLSETGRTVEASAVAQVTSKSFKDYLKKITSLESRSCSDPEASQKAVSLLQDEFDKIGLQTCLHTFGSSMVNVIAYSPGVSTDSVIVGAHYDSRPFSGAAPGAEDNGSGVASLLAMAKAFKEAKVASHKGVYFVGFAGEEEGLLGSQAFSDALAEGGSDIPDKCKPATSQSFLQLKGSKTALQKKTMMGVGAAIIMDEVGWMSPSFTNADGTIRETVNLEAYDWTAPLLDTLASSSRDHNGDSLYITHSGNPFGSDHMSFLNKDMQCVLTINGDDESYPNYHQSTDTIENVNAAYATKIAKMNMGALVRMIGVA